MWATVLCLAAGSSMGAARRTVQTGLETGLDSVNSSRAWTVRDSSCSGTVTRDKFLVVRLNFLDYEAEPWEKIKEGCETAWGMMKRDSYDRYIPDVEYKEVKLNMSFKDQFKIEPDLWMNQIEVIHDQACDKAVPNKDIYKVRFVYLPPVRDAGVPFKGGVNLKLGTPHVVMQYTNWHTVAHEAGHALGFSHAKSILVAERSFEQKEWWDCQAIMGSNRMPACKSSLDAGIQHYSAACRWQLGWLKEQRGEVKATTAPTLKHDTFYLTDLFDPLSEKVELPGGAKMWSYKAIKLPCLSCKPQDREHKEKNPPSSLFVSLAKDTVHVHLWIQDGTEHWGQLDSVGQEWQPPTKNVLDEPIDTGASISVRWSEKGTHEGGDWARVDVEQLGSEEDPTEGPTEDPKDNEGRDWLCRLLGLFCSRDA